MDEGAILELIAVSVAEYYFGALGKDVAQGVIDLTKPQPKPIGRILEEQTRAFASIPSA